MISLDWYLHSNIWLKSSKFRIHWMIALWFSLTSSHIAIWNSSPLFSSRFLSRCAMAASYDKFHRVNSHVNQIQWVIPISWWLKTQHFFHRKIIAKNNISSIRESNSITSPSVSLLYTYSINHMQTINRFILCNYRYTCVNHIQTIYSPYPHSTWTWVGKCPNVSHYPTKTVGYFISNRYLFWWCSSNPQ